MDYTQEQLSGLIAEVEKEFKTHLAKAEDSFKLAKSEDFPPKKDESKEKDEKKAGSEGSDSKKPMESEKPEDKGVKDQDQQAMDKPGKDDQGQPGENKPGAMPAQGEDHGYDDEDMQHMYSMYSSMSKPELKAHHDTIRQCMDGMGLAKCEDGMAKSELEDCKEGEHRPNGGPKDGEAAKSKTPASSDTQALTKSEPSMEISLLKSELELAKAESDKNKKNLDAVEAFLKKFVEKTAPAGKAITSLDIIAKTEGVVEKPLSKSEIDAKLLAKAKDPSLSKSDREAINGFYFSKNIEKVNHLLK